MDPLPLTLLISGVCVSGLLFAVIRFAGARRQALADRETLSRDLRETEEDLRIAAQVFEASSEGILITDREANVVAVNRSFTEMCGYSREDLIGRSPRILQSRLLSDREYEAMWEALTTQGHWQGEIWDRRKDGRLFAQWVTLNASRNQAGEVTHYVGICSDITERKRDQERVQFLAHHDPLTGLPNRTLLWERMRTAIGEAGRNDWEVAILIVDLDRFKVVNDTLGHLAGDKILQQVAERLRTCVRYSDTVARLGGDEFAIVLARCDGPTGPTQVARKILSVLSAPAILDGEEVQLGASIGISLWPADGEEATTLARHADLAMYETKRAGGGAFRFYSPSGGTGRGVPSLQDELRAALDEGRFLLHYQPEVEIATGQITGAEGLLRWSHPGLGLLYPDQFREAAEEANLGGSLADWFLAAACRDARRMEETHGTAISVSVRGFDAPLRDGELPRRVARALEGTGLSPRLLEIAFSETELMQGASASIRVLQELRDLGVRIALEDFGAGFTSLSYLLRWPVTRVKIASSVIRRVPGDPKAEELVSTIVALARRLGLRVIARGVGSQEQVSFLRRHGCEHGLGFHWCEPLPLDELLGSLPPDGRVPVPPRVAPLDLEVSLSMRRRHLEPQ